MKIKLLPLAIVIGVAVSFGIYAVWVANAGQTSSPSDQGHAVIANSADSSASKAFSESYGRIEMAFEENMGQMDPSVGFLARGAGYTLFLKPDEAVLSLSKPERDEKRSDEMPVGPGRGTATGNRVDPKPAATRFKGYSALRMKILGANGAAEASRMDELEGKVNYLIGNDPTKWRTNVSTYGRVRYSDVYKGIDVEYYGNQRRLEYDFRVEPGADYRQISLKFEGAESVKVEPETGDLLIAVDGQTVRQHKPIVYQEFDGERREIASSFNVTGSGNVGFEVAEYDNAKSLIIDPVLVYSTFLGGNAEDIGYGIAVDQSGNVYVTGTASSTNFPTVNPLQGAKAGDISSSYDAFVTKINATGSAIIYSTYLGGVGGDDARGVALDAAGNAYISGYTTSTDFPTVNAIQGTNGGGYDAFLAKINTGGSALVYSTYIGGSGPDFESGIALDSSGNAYLTGNTLSTNFPVTPNALQGTKSGDWDLFITKVDPSGSALSYSTYLGGTKYDYAGGIAVDGSGNAYVTGMTASGFPLQNPIQANFGGGTDDGFVTKINSAGTALLYSTYLGGSNSEGGSGIAVDAAGNAFVTGSTRSTNFPTLNPIQGPAAGIGSVTDAFVTKINPAGSAFVYSTYLGGTDGDVGSSIAIDQAGNAYIAGGTGSSNFPTVPANPGGYGGSSDAFVAKINPAGSGVAYSTFLGGSGPDQGYGVALDSIGNAYVTGRASGSSNFPTVNPIPSANGGGLADAFVAKIADGTGPFPTPQPTPTPTPSPTPAPYSGNIVISQVYGGGGLPGATYRNSYIEVFNRGTATEVIGGLVVALASGSNNFSISFISSRGISLAPGQHKLIKMGSSGNNGAELPEHDHDFSEFQNSSLGLSGKVAIVAPAGPALSGPCPWPGPQIVDLVGYGGTNCFEGNGAAGSLNVSTAAFRKNNGCTDTNNNASDFTVGAPNPRNASSTFTPCSVTPTPTPVPQAAEAFGRVTGPLGRGVPRARVRFADAAGNEWSAPTTTFGYFRLAGLSAGVRYTVTVERVQHRYDSAPRSVTLSGGPNELDLQVQQR